MEAYRIEDLAAESGATVRTIRAYQDRGLLPRPERRGRVNLYGPAHLARLRQIADLLDRGYTLASIKELLEAWDSGTGLGGVLGLFDEMHQPWSDERPVRIRRSVLTETFGGRNEEAIAEAVSLGVLRPLARPVAPTGQGGAAGHEESRDPGDPDAPRTAEGPEELEDRHDHEARQDREDPDDGEGHEDEEYLVLSPRELTVAAELHAAGVPLMAIGSHLRELRGQVEHIAERFMEFTIEYVFGRFLDHTPSEAEATEAADLVRRLRPLAQQTVDVELARAMHALSSGIAQARVTGPASADAPTSALARALAEARAEPAPDPTHLNVPLPVTTLHSVRALVGPQHTAAFITAAAEREVQARTMDALAAGRSGETGP